MNTIAILKEFEKEFDSIKTAYSVSAIKNHMMPIIAAKLQEVERATILDTSERIQQQVEYDDFIPEPYNTRVIKSIKRVKGE